MRVAILQPGYLPWLGYFEQMQVVDLFISLDDVAYTKQDWRNRNRIRTNAPEGWSWLTVPVVAATARGRIDQVRIPPVDGWWPKHLRMLDQHYGQRGAPGYPALREELIAVVETGHDLLADLDLALAAVLAARLGIATPVVRASTLAVEVAPGDKSGRLLALCQAAGASALYDGKSAADFLDVPRFAAAGIEVTFQDFQHPVHRQSYEGFVPCLSAVDFVAWSRMPPETPGRAILER